MGKIIKAEKRGGGGIESKVIEEYTPLIPIFFTNDFVGKSVIANDNKKLRIEIIFLV